MVLVRCVDDRWCWQCRECGRLDPGWYPSETEAMDLAQEHEVVAHPPRLVMDRSLTSTV
jgi:hypothetical protein